MVTIADVQLLDKTLPIVGKRYGVGRITKLEGDIPPEVQALVYSDGVEKVSPLPEEVGYMSKVGAIYVFLEITTDEEDDSKISLRIIENYDDFLSPFEFPESTRNEFEEHFLGTRLGAAQLQDFEFDVADEDAEGGVTKCKAFYNITEMAYIASGATELNQFFSGDKVAELKANSPVMMIFAESLTKGIDVYNQINFYDKAKDFARQIEDITAINQDGEKTTLTFSAVKGFFDMIMDNLRVGR